MLALKDYGSSDDGSGTEDEKISGNLTCEVKCVVNTNVDLISKPFCIDKLTTPINLQICSAPDVVPTVSISLHTVYCNVNKFLLL